MTRPRLNVTAKTVLVLAAFLMCVFVLAGWTGEFDPVKVLTVAVLFLAAVLLP